MEKITVLFCWQPGDYLREELKKVFPEDGKTRILFSDDDSLSEMKEKAKECNIMVGWRPDVEVLKVAKKCEYFITPATGVQHLIELFQEISKTQALSLVNSHGNSYQTAQHAVALLLSLTNKIIPHHGWLKDGEWRKSDEDAATYSLRDVTVGFLGYGAINRQVHRFLHGFDITFAAVKRQWDETAISDSLKQFSREELNDFLRTIDILIVSLPQTSSTVGLIGEHELKLLGKQGLLINIGRGAVIDEKALFQALKGGVIAGAGIDVWYNYRAEADEQGRRYPWTWPFQELNNVILSPHRAASPLNNRYRWDDIISLIKRCADGRVTRDDIVDLEVEY